MDLKAVNETLKDSFEVEILHPVTGEGGWFLELASPHHPESQAKVAAILDRSRKRKINTAAQDEKDGMDLVIARILGWRGLQEGGEEVEYTPEKAAKILSDRKAFWIRNQIMEALGDLSRPFGH